MQLTTMKQKNSTEVPSLKLKLYGKKIGDYLSLQRKLAKKQN